MDDLQEALVEKPKKGKKVLIAGAVFSLVVVLGALFFFTAGLNSKESNRGEGQAASGPRKGIEGHLYAMEPFLVNLADADRAKYLKVRMDLESTDKKPVEEYRQRLPQLRDAILGILSGKKYAEINHSEGKKNLKEEIISKLNPLITHFKVRAVYFTEFVVQ